MLPVEEPVLIIFFSKSLVEFKDEDSIQYKYPLVCAGACPADLFWQILTFFWVNYLCNLKPTSHVAASMIDGHSTD